MILSYTTRSIHDIRGERKVLELPEDLLLNFLPTQTVHMRTATSMRTVRRGLFSVARCRIIAHSQTAKVLVAGVTQ